MTPNSAWQYLAFQCFRYQSRLAVALVCSSLWSAAAAATPVVELKPDEVAAFVAKHKYAVVQVTSPDRGCGFCIGADKTFDQAAAAKNDRGIAFGRVQHTPWRAIPKFGALMTVYGVPSHNVFLDGKETGYSLGRPDSAAALIGKMEGILDGKEGRTLQARHSDAPVPAYQPMTGQQRQVTRVMVRRDLLRGITRLCGGLFPQGAADYARAMQTWEESHKTELNEALRLLFTRTGREDAAEMSPLVALEQRSLQEWQVNKLGISMNAKPKVEDCDGIAKGLQSLP